MCVLAWGNRACNWRRGGVDRAPWLDPPPSPKMGSIDGTQNPTETDPGLGGDPHPKLGKKMKWDFWNQRVEGVQKSHHLPYICLKKNDQF